MLGHDVIYLNETSDDELLELAEGENRILLTRDLELYRRACTRKLDTLYLKGKTTAEKLVEVVKQCKIKLELDTSLSRCPVCGSQIQHVKKSKVINLVPEKTFQRYSDFWMCMSCGKVYWQGSHWEKINNTLEEAKKLLEKSNESKPQSSM